MLKNMEGTMVPDVTFRTRQANEWLDVTSEEIFEGKSVVVFSLPGAYTPTCSSAHVPGYNELASVFKVNGVDDIVCLSVNDCFVTNEWQKDQHAENITFLPDGNGEFTEKLGMLVDKSDLGCGKRSWPFSMFVKDELIDKMFVEPEIPGDPFEVSDAETMLSYVNPEAARPKRISVLSKKGRPHCARAKRLPRKEGLQYEEIESGRDVHSYDQLVLPHLDAVFRAAMAACGSRHDAEDLAQATLVRALERFDTFKPGTNCKAWLYQILRNLRTDQLRHMKVVGKTRSIDDEGMDIEDEHSKEVIWSNAEDSLENFSDEQVIKAMRQLPEEQRLSLFLTEVERFSYQEVADITGVAIGTVKSRINRARALLTQKLQDYAKEMGFLETRT